MRNTHQSSQRHHQKKGFLKLDFAAWLSISVMSIAGAVAVYLYHFKNPFTEALTSSDTTEETSTNPVINVTYSGNIDAIANQCKSMVSSESSFVIFEYGTCVRLLEPVSNHAESSISSLKILSSPNIDFAVKPLPNNNYLIVFNEYLLCWLFAKDIADMKEAILTDDRLAPSDSDSEIVSKLSDLERRIGKFARLLLQEDAKTLVIKKIIRANLANSKAP